MQLAVVIDVDGDIMYVPEGAVFENFPKPKLFDNLRDAQEECDKWNTGVIVNYETGESVPVIKSFDEEERARAKYRKKVNNDIS